MSPSPDRALKLMALLAVLAAASCRSTDAPKPPPPEYLGLANQRVAVMVSAAPTVVVQSTEAPEHLMTAIAQKIAVNVEGVRLADPRQVAKFQQDNPAWTVTPYGTLLDRLGVQRLVVVDLADYRLHEPGNIHMWQASAIAHVSVAAADDAHPNNPVYSTTVNVQYPPDQPLGALEGNTAGMELGLNDALARRIAMLFGKPKKEK